MALCSSALRLAACLRLPATFAAPSSSLRRHVRKADTHVDVTAEHAMHLSRSLKNWCQQRSLYVSVPQADEACSTLAQCAYTRWQHAVSRHSAPDQDEVHGPQRVDLAGQVAHAAGQRVAGHAHVPRPANVPMPLRRRHPVQHLQLGVRGKFQGDELRGRGPATDST